MVIFIGLVDMVVKLCVYFNLIVNFIFFNVEVDLLNCVIFGFDVNVDDEEFDFFVKEVVCEMIIKVG